MSSATAVNRDGRSMPVSFFFIFYFSANPMAVKTPAAATLIGRPEEQMQPDSILLQAVLYFVVLCFCSIGFLCEMYKCFVKAVIPLFFWCWGRRV